MEWRNGGVVDGMAEWRNGGMAEWRNGGMVIEWRNGGNGRTTERMAEWQNGRSGYIRTIYGTRWRNGGWNGGMVDWREWLNGGNGGNGGTAQWRKGYIPNLPDIFTVHANDNDDDTF